MNNTSLQFFISYCHQDMRIKEKLITSLKALSFEYNINEIWHDCEILSGENIDVKVLQKLNESNIILLLVSKYFMASHLYGY